MARNSVKITKQDANKVSIQETNNTVQLTEETVKVVHVGTLVEAGADAKFTFAQEQNSDQWEVQHNLGKFPSVTIVDSGENIVFAEVQYTDENNLTISFNGATSGKAYLN